ncbi:hypothetical protein Agub_g10948 [Astrephomene gubernaculifera]|uniref:RING-type domain-containing protein n=1 Tax=Astrephomene gubernaculifera TaxID=47775 RepID=A0AAD3DVT9_9CHLO|nr:hypothetical protein Agub_g10948 [Astrephomene gubernaculifera]
MRNVALSLLVLIGSASTTFGAWKPETFPNPMKDVTKCGRRGVPSWVCDPDGVIPYDSANVVEGTLKKIFAGEEPYALGPCGSAGPKGFQVAVALVRRMSFTGDAEKAAKRFATALHDSWGVGDAACGNGVLLFLSQEDRQLYISTGAGADKRLTYDVLGDILDDVRPSLKNSKYDEAVERAVVDIGLALAGRPVEPEGEQTSGWEEVTSLGIFASVAGGLIWWASRMESRKRRRYQDCKSKLEKLKRDQAAMRARSYNPTSCPVCLEDFVDDSSSNNGAGAADASKPEGSHVDTGIATAAAAPTTAVALGPATATTMSSTPAGACCSGHHHLPAGAPAAAGAATPAGAETEAELLQPLMTEASSVNGRGGGGGGNSATETAAAGAAAAAAGGQQQPQPPRRPLVLPCGHAFCEPCITQWLEQKKVTCPICRRPIDDDDANTHPTSPRQPPSGTSRTSTTPSDINNRNSNNDRNGNSNNNGTGAGGASSSSGPRPPCTVDDDEDYFDATTTATAGSDAGGFFGSAGLPPRLRLRWGRNRYYGGRWQQHRLTDELLLSEMVFRLRQLQRQHPEYIDNRMAEAWEADLRSGRELNPQQLRSFQLLDPANRSALAGSGRSGASSGFGGGSSMGGGGRGGSW